MNRFFHLFLLLIGLVTLFSCADDAVCINNNTSLVKIRFKNFDGVSEDVIINSLTAVENNALYPQYTQDTTSSVVISLNPREPVTTLEFIIQDTLRTLELSYTLLPQFISPECGMYISFSNLGVTSHSFDSLVLVQPIIDEQVNTNIEIIH